MTNIPTAITWIVQYL